MCQCPASDSGITLPPSYCSAKMLSNSQLDEPCSVWTKNPSSLDEGSLGQKHFRFRIPGFFSFKIFPNLVNILNPKSAAFLSIPLLLRTAQ